MKDALVVVTPIYEDTQSAEQLISELKNKFKNKIYIVAVDDGSIVEPVKIDILNKVNADGVVLKLVKNVGHQKAIAIGLQYVADQLDWADRVVVMDSDGEDNPDTIIELLKKLDQDNIDIAVGQRRNRSEAFQFKFFYKIYKVIFTSLTGRSFGFGNFTALKSSSLQRIVKMPEIWTHFAATILSSKLRLAECPLDRGQRYFGKSKLNFVGFALHGFKALMVFSEEVLVRVGIFCAFIAFLSVAGGMTAILLKFLGIATPGWFSVVMGVFVLVFLQTGTLTLMTLLLTGIVKNNLPEEAVYNQLIKSVMKADCTAKL